MTELTQDQYRAMWANPGDRQQERMNIRNGFLYADRDTMLREIEYRRTRNQPFAVAALMELLAEQDAEREQRAEAQDAVKRVARDRHYAALNARMDQRAAALLALGFKHGGCFTIMRAHKELTIPNAKVLYCDEIVWQDALAEAERFIKAFSAGK